MPRLRSLGLTLTLLVLAAPALFAGVPAESALIQATDLLKIRQLEAPALSPDGRWVVYVVRTIEPKPGAKDDWVYRSHLWLVPADGSAAPRQLTHAGVSNSDPNWSPSGDRIAFVRTLEKEKPQVYELSLAGGEATPLTKLETGATSPRWSHDGARILFSTSLSYEQVRAAQEKDKADAKPKWKTERPGRAANDTAIWPASREGAEAKKEPGAKADPDGDLAARREWLAKNEAAGNPRALDRLNFQSESDIDPELTFAHVLVQEAREGATARDLTPGYFSVRGAEWLPDGKSIVGVTQRADDEHPDRSERTRIVVIDTTAATLRTLVDAAGFNYGSPMPSPDGATIAFTATPGDYFGYGQAEVAVVPTAGGATRYLTENLDRGAGELRWSPDGKFIYFTAPTGGAFPLYRVAATGGEVARLDPEPQLGVRAFAIGQERLVQVQTRATNPYELYSGPVDGKAARPISSHNADWLRDKKLSAYEPHRLVDADGLNVDYWTMKPTSFESGKKYPLLLEIHGGPAAMWGPGEDSMWFEFQFFAARGYAIVFSNPRGSGGYGYTFQHANYRDWGVGPSSDILSAVSFVEKESFVDTHREVMTGGSYGGYMTAWIVGHDHRFKAAVAQRGVYDLLTFFGEGNAWRLVPRAFGGYPWEPDVHHILERDSPITYVENITTPLLMQHGDSDRRTGFVQSEMMLRSLKVLGRDVEEVRYPRATHELSRSGEPRQRLDTLVRYEEFFRRYIGEDQAQGGN
ncbi:MAG TPA: S9 family peptidase [Candidatus Didemnitutus sp.]|nr:S9 family peptidase [Candidatus Didemnitutus sp.]